MAVCTTFRFRFSLRTMLMVVTLVGVACALFGNVTYRARNQLAAVNRIEELDGTIQFRGAKGGFGSNLVRRWLGDHAVETVVYVSLSRTRVSDGDMALFEALPDIEELSLSDTQVGDRGIK